MEPDKGPRIATSQPVPRNGLASARRGVVVPHNDSSWPSSCKGYGHGERGPRQ
jgi:hypothetical protein